MATTINASTSAGLVSTADTSGVLQLQAANTTVLNAELGKALALQGATSTTGCGIAFPATQVTSTDVNTLDDYEEGTWSPTIAGSTSAGTVTYNTRSATYTKVGRVVFIQFLVNYSSGTGTGNMLITNLPFASTVYSTISLVNAGAPVTSGNVPVGLILNSGTQINMQQLTPSSSTTANITYSASGETIASATYLTT